MVGQEETPAVRSVELRKHFRRTDGTRVQAVEGVDLQIERGEMVVVLGPSGCGKTTLLRCIAGLESPTDGEIWSGSTLISSGARGVIEPPERRNFGMIFQSYAVWPHMSVSKNVAYPLAGMGLSKRELTERVNGALELVGIGDLEHEYPADLSGGQQQRIAFARCLVADPAVILFDEPLSNVDAKVREELRIELRTMQQQIGFAGLYVTHDQEEAMAIADRVVVMRSGCVQQVGPPEDVYNRPDTRFTANFIGVANEWAGVVTGVDLGSSARVDTEFGEVRIPADNIAGQVGVGDDVFVVARPESVSMRAETSVSEAEGIRGRGRIETVMFRGAYYEYLVDAGSSTFRSRGPKLGLGVGEEVSVYVDPGDVRVVLSDEPGASVAGSSSKTLESPLG